MPRCQKEGLDYFPLDVNFFSDKKIKILKARYGVDGVTLYLYLLCEIYRAGYYIRLDDDSIFILSDDLNMSADKVKQVLNFLLERSLFERTLFQSDKVLTSAGIQKRFQLAVKERAKKNPIQIKGFWLLNEKETEPFIQVNPSRNNSGNYEDISRKNESHSPELSLKESKGKKSIIKHRQEPEKAPIPDDPKYASDSFEMQCVEALIKSCLETYTGSKVPESRKDKEKWADEIERMKRIDKRTEEEIQSALEYAITSPFWKSNIRSAGKFREKFEILIVQKNSRGKDTQIKDKNRFHNFDQRKDVDYETMMWKAVREGGGISGA